MTGVWKGVAGLLPGRESRERRAAEKAVDEIVRRRKEIERTGLPQDRRAGGRPRDARDAIALACEAARRSLGLDPDRMQIDAAVRLRERNIVEMATGDGKTLAAGLAVAADALSGRRAHVVTANDYLAERDAAWMKPLFDALGVTVSCRIRGQSHDDRRRAHAAEIIYGTAGELSFDFLTDGLRRDKDGAVCQAFDACIIDEVDHILIDDATNPLVISGDLPTDESMCRLVNEFVAGLEPAHIAIDLTRREVALSDDGVMLAEAWFAKRDVLSGVSLFEMQNLQIVNRIWQALRAYHFVQRDREYVVQDGKVLLLDPRTGRITRGRLPGGLHQAVEAREGAALSPEPHPVAALNMRAFGSLYARVSGMTATATLDADEFAHVYGLRVVPIASAIPRRRVDLPDRVFASARERDERLLRLVAERHGRGQPVLIGTMSIPRSDELSAMLAARAIPHNVLHAHFTPQEAAIVAEAGRAGAVTVATNMAGRGTDIVLGGTPASIADPRERENGRAAAMSAGGLLVIGCGRQKLRRLDDQLRGRAGRRGDPGESIFLLSIEDEIFEPLQGASLQRLAEQSAREADGSLSEPKLAGIVRTIQERNRRNEAEARNTARSYDEIAEKQRQILWAHRAAILVPYQPRAADIEEAGRGAAELCGLDAAAGALLALRDPAEARAVLHGLLDILDSSWQEHVAALDEIRQAIGWRSIAGRNPLTEYASEALARFHAMLARIRAAGAKRLTAALDPARRAH